jgi:hypothetical protein
MQPEVRAIPALLAFGPRKVGQVAESTVTLQVPPGSHWVVDHIETDSAGLSADPVSDTAMPAGRVYRIRQLITKTGHQATTVRFFVRKEKGEPTPLAMEATYDGEGMLSNSRENGADR